MENFVNRAALATSDRAFRTAEDRARAVAMPPAEKQLHLRTMLIRYPLFNETCDKIRRFHMPVEGGIYDVGKIGGVVGRQRGGKTYAVRSYVGGLGGRRTEEAIVTRGIYVDVSDSWYAVHFAQALYRQLGLPRPPREQTSTMFETVVDEIEHHGIELLAVDDAQFLLRSSRSSTVKEVFGFLVQLAERRCCSILLVGTEDVASAVEGNAHADGRGGFPKIHVDPYAWSEPEGRENFLLLLQAIDDRLPFASPSGLAHPVIAAHLYKMSGGLIGRVMNVVVDAAHAALCDRADRVEVDHLREAATTRLRSGSRYVPFSTKIDMELPIPEELDDEPVDRDPRPSLSKRRRRSALG